MAGFVSALVVCFAAAGSTMAAVRLARVIGLAFGIGRMKQGSRSPNPPYQSQAGLTYSIPWLVYLFYFPSQRHIYGYIYIYIYIYIYNPRLT